jgi:hypothetical protein
MIVIVIEIEIINNNTLFDENLISLLTFINK